MKTKLFLLFTLCCSICFSQIPIASFNSAPMSNFTIVSSTPAIDQMPTGANATWTFNNLTATGTNIDTYAAPTAAEITTYPGTTEVLSTTTQGGTPVVNSFFIREDMTGTYFTGVSQGDIILNYATTNAFIGLFPLNFGYSNTDSAAGTFSFMGTNGTFTGSLTVTVDAYGTLNLNNTGTGAYSGNVTRLRLDQSLSFSIPPIFNNIGTLTQTSYFYYDNTSSDLAFRYSNAILVSAFLGLNQTTEVLERNSLNTLSTTSFNETNAFQLFPNPVKDHITVLTKDNDILKQVTIVNVTGQEVLKVAKNTTSITVKDLPNGFYILTIETESGKFITKKFIKK